MRDQYKFPGTVILDEEDRARANRVAGLRNSESRRQGGAPCPWSPEDEGTRRKMSVEADTNGALAEVAFAKWLGVHWDASINTFKEIPDVEGWEVRATKHRFGKLIIRSRDRMERRYALVVVMADRCIIPGWIYGHEAKQRGEVTNFGIPGAAECLAVKQYSLRKEWTVEELKR